jgi:3-methyl-2-oxobutanoate hydroxymethyltransferase
MQDALAVEKAGAFAVVIEMVPADVAKEVSEALAIPTIGIGAGPHTDGQILVWTDLAGLSTSRVPKFVKQYANLEHELRGAVSTWIDEVSSGIFPGPEHSFDED